MIIKKRFKNHLLFLMALFIVTPQHSKSMGFDFDSKKTMAFVGTFLGGIAACIVGQYLWKKLRPKTPEKPSELPMNASIMYRISLWSADYTYALDTNSCKLYSMTPISDIQVHHEGSEFRFKMGKHSADEYIFDKNANVVYGKEPNKEKVEIWRYL